MNYKKLIFISLLIMILTLGAVSAADDVETNQTLEVDDASDIMEVPDDYPAVGEEEYFESDDGAVNIYVNEYNVVDEFVHYLSYVYDENNLNGTVRATIDDDDVFYRQYDGTEGEQFCEICTSDLSKVPSLGIHSVTVIYQKNGVDEPYELTNNVNFTFTFELVVDGDINRDYAFTTYNEYPSVGIMFPKDAEPEFTFKLDGKSLKYKTQNGLAYPIYKSKLTIGKHSLKIIFKDKSGKYPVRSVTVPIFVEPVISYADVISVGEKDTVDIKGPKGSKITAILFKENRKTKLLKVSGTTSVSIPIYKYLKKGSNSFYISYKCDGYKSGDDIYIYCFKNSDKVKVSVKKIGDSAKVTIKGPKNDEAFVTVSRDHIGVIGKYINFKKGYYKKAISSLSVGKHKIKVTFKSGKIRYSQTFFVKVSAKDKVSLSLNKAKVNKSAKKLVLKSTLKINKKAKKGLTVTFKFNGKKFKAKTNKKGVAKVTLKNKYFKNLKVGQKVIYKAHYSFKTVKRASVVQG